MVHIIFASDSNEPPLDKQTINNFARLVQLSKSITENDAVSDEGTESPLLDKDQNSKDKLFQPSIEPASHRIQFHIEPIGTTSKSQAKGHLILRLDLIQILHATALIESMVEIAQISLFDPTHVLKQTPTAGTSNAEEIKSNRKGLTPTESMKTAYNVHFGQQRQIFDESLAAVLLEARQLGTRINGLCTAISGSNFFSKYGKVLKSRAVELANLHLSRTPIRQSDESDQFHRKINHSFVNFITQMEEFKTIKTHDQLYSTILNATDTSDLEGKLYVDPRRNDTAYKQGCLDEGAAGLCYQVRPDFRQITQPPKTRSKRQAMLAFAALAAGLGGILGWNLKTPYQQHQMLEFNRHLASHDDAIKGLSKLIKTEHDLTQENFHKIILSMHNLFRVTARGVKLVSALNQEVLVNHFVLLFNTVVNNVHKGLDDILHAFMFSQRGSFPFFLFNSKQLELTLNKLTSEASVHNLQPYDSTPNVLQTATCQPLKTPLDLFFMSCQFPLKSTDSTSEVEIYHFPKQHLLVGGLVVELDLSEKYLFFTNSSYATMGEMEFNNHCTQIPKSNSGNPFITCRQGYPEFYHLIDNTTKNCQVRLLNQDLDNLVEYCPLRVITNAHEFMVRKSFETYELTPLNGESTVATLNCSSSQMQTSQYYVDKKTEIHVSPYCELSTSTIYVPRRDILGDIKLTHTVIGGFKDIFSRSKTILKLLDNLSENPNEFAIKLKNEILPLGNDSFFLKDLEKFASKQSLSNQLKSFGPSLVITHSSIIFYALTATAFFICCMMYRRRGTRSGGDESVQSQTAAHSHPARSRPRKRRPILRRLGKGPEPENDLQELQVLQDASVPEASSASAPDKTPAPQQPPSRGRRLSRRGFSLTLEQLDVLNRRVAGIV